MAIADHGSLTDDTPDVPEHCPRCRRVQVQAAFEIVDDWRDVRRPKR